MTTTKPTFGPLQIGIALLTVATAVIHLVLAVPNQLVLFYLNALGYLALLAALYLPIAALAPYRHLVRWALIAYTAVTVIAWAAIGDRSAIAYADKAIEVALIVLLLLEGRQAKR
ncbi:MAG: hypothetical protein NZ528_10710 [Caldilineales bacterium]|nr:hypothetical protein [Caldilineales bacterium]MDW8317636.1 hypothetical protein [Anaerolineae bacterium]